MLQVSKYNESQLTQMATVVGKSVDEMLTTLIEVYQDTLDVKEAEEALKEEGVISLSQLKEKYAL